jgi:hypothetical protein
MILEFANTTKLFFAREIATLMRFGLDKNSVGTLLVVAIMMQSISFPWNESTVAIVN